MTYCGGQVYSPESPGLWPSISQEAAQLRIQAQRVSGVSCTWKSARLEVQRPVLSILPCKMRTAWGCLFGLAFTEAQHLVTLCGLRVPGPLPPPIWAVKKPLKPALFCIPRRRKCSLLPPGSSPLGFLSHLLPQALPTPTPSPDSTPGILRPARLPRLPFGRVGGGTTRKKLCGLVSREG